MKLDPFLIVSLIALSFGKALGSLDPWSREG